MHSSSSIALAVIFSAVPACAQTIWKVVSGAGLPTAIAAASPGDVLLLNPGGLQSFEFEPFILNKGLTIRGNGSRPGYNPSYNYQVKLKIPPGETAHLEDLRFDSNYSPYGNLGTPVLVESGTVRFESCLITFGNGTSLTLRDANVTLADCTILGRGNIGSGPGIHATRSVLALRDSQVTGADAALHPGGWQGIASPAIVLRSSSLHAERSSLRGGSHGTQSFAGDGAPALDAAGSKAWLADCSLTGGSSTQGVGAPAIVNTSVVPIAMRSATLIAGNGAVKSTGPINPAAPLIRLALAPAWQRGVTSVLSLSGDSTASFGLWYAINEAAVLLPLVAEPVSSVGAISITGGVLDASGNASISIPVPNISLLQHTTVWFQAGSVSGSQVRVSTLAGGVVR